MTNPNTPEEAANNSVVRPTILGRALSYFRDSLEFARAGQEVRAQTRKTAATRAGSLQVSPSVHPAYEQSLALAEQQANLNSPNNDPRLYSANYHDSLFDAPLRAMSQSSSVHRNLADTPGTNETLRISMLSSWVYGDIKLISDRIGSESAWPVVKRIDPNLAVHEYETDKGHPFEQLLRRPNPLMTGAYLMKYTAWWRFLLGNAYIFISTEEVGVGDPLELWPLPANKVKPMPQTLRYGLGNYKDKLVIDYEYIVDENTTQILPGENVIHVRTPNPFDWWQGLSPLSASLMGVQLDYSQKKWMRDFFGKDNAVPTAIISLPKEMRESEFVIAREQIRQQFADGKKSMITRGGDLTVELIKQTIDEMGIVPSRQFNKIEQDRIFGVPAGLSDSTTGDALLSSEIIFARNTIQPAIDDMCADMTSNIGPYYGPEFVLIAPDTIPQNRAILIQEFGQYKAVRSYNENRKHLGRPPMVCPPALSSKIGGFDLFEDVPMGIVPLLLGMQQAQDAADNAMQVTSLHPPAGSGPTASVGSGNYQVEAARNNTTSVTGSKQSSNGTPANQGRNANTPGGQSGVAMPSQTVARNSTRSTNEIDLEEFLEFDRQLTELFSNITSSKIAAEVTHNLCTLGEAEVEAEAAEPVAVEVAVVADPIMKEAIKGELKKWRTITRKASSGNHPLAAAKTFTSEVLTTYQIAELSKAIETTGYGVLTLENMVSLGLILV